MNNLANQQNEISTEINISSIQDDMYSRVKMKCIYNTSIWFQNNSNLLWQVCTIMSFNKRCIFALHYSLSFLYYSDLAAMGANESRVEEIFDKKWVIFKEYNYSLDSYAPGLREHTILCCEYI